MSYTKLTDFAAKDDLLTGNPNKIVRGEEIDDEFNAIETAFSTVNAATVTVADAAADTTTWVLLGTSQTGNLAPATDAGLTYNATTNALTATTFVGALTGNADSVTVADAAADTTTWVLLGTSQTGSLAPATDAGLTYNASTNALTATTFIGALTGTASGNYSPGGTDVALADGGTGASLADPNADRIMFWDDSAGAVTWLTAGTGLTITGTTIDASGSVTNGDSHDHSGGDGAQIAYSGLSGLPVAGTDFADPDVSSVWTASQSGAFNDLTDGATITPDFANINFRVTLGGNRTLANPSNMVKGQSGAIYISQDGTGSRTLATGWMYPVAGVTLSTVAGTTDALYYSVIQYAQATVTISNASPGVVTWTAHGLLNGQKIQLTTTGGLPTGLSVSTTYYVKRVDADTFQLSSTIGGASINTSSAGSGTHTCTAGAIDITLKKGVM